MRSRESSSSAGALQRVARASAGAGAGAGAGVGAGVNDEFMSETAASTPGVLAWHLQTPEMRS